MKLKVLNLLLSVLLVVACGDDDGRTPESIVPNIPVNLRINLNNPLYIDAGVRGGYAYIDGEGYRGIILYHDFDGQFYAVDRACTYNIQDSCARVTVDETQIFARCGSFKTPAEDEFEPCCDSRFELNGFVNRGPANVSLRRYNVLREGDVVFITN